jgi:hypothetical protein
MLSLNFSEMTGHISFGDTSKRAIKKTWIFGASKQDMSSVTWTGLNLI